MDQDSHQGQRPAIQLRLRHRRGRIGGPCPAHSERCSPGHGRVGSTQRTERAAHHPDLPPQPQAGHQRRSRLEPDHLEAADGCRHDLGTERAGAVCPAGLGVLPGPIPEDLDAAEAHPQGGASGQLRDEPETDGVLHVPEQRTVVLEQRAVHGIQATR